MRVLAVLAFVAAGSCGGSDSAPTEIVEGGIPAAIRAAIAGTTVNLTWDPVAGAVGYRIYMAEVGGVKKINVTTLAGNMSHAHGETLFEHPAGLLASKKYYFVVTSILPGNKESRESCEVTAKILTNEGSGC